MAKSKTNENGVGYYNIDNIDNEIYNKENIVEYFSSFGTGGKASSTLRGQGVETESLGGVIKQAATPNHDTVKRAIAQIFENNNSTQRHKIKLKIHLTDDTAPEWIASMSKDARIFRKYQTDLDLAREWLAVTREYFSSENGYKKPYWGKFHVSKDDTGTQTLKIQKEPGCFAAMAYNTRDESWYAMFKLFDWITPPHEFDYNFTGLQKAQGVKGQWVWSNPRLEKQKRPQTWAERRGIK